MNSLGVENLLGERGGSFLIGRIVRGKLGLKKPGGEKLQKWDITASEIKSSHASKEERESVTRGTEYSAT